MAAALLPAKLLIWNALSAMLFRLANDIQPVETLISYDTTNQALAQTIARTFSNNTSFVVLNLHTEYQGPLWRSVFNNPYAKSMSIVVLDSLDGYARLVNAYLNVLLRQTVVICTASDRRNRRANWSHIRYVAHFGRLVIVFWSPDSADYEVYTWAVALRTYRRLSGPEQLFNRSHPHVQLFWNNVQGIPQPPVFQFDLLPPEHANNCPHPTRCYAFGPYVYLARQIAETFAGPAGYRAPLLPYTGDAYDDRLRQLYVGYTFGEAAEQLLRDGRATRDGFHTYERTERTQPQNRTRLEHSRRHTLLTMTHGMGQLYPIHYDAVRLIVPRRSGFRAQLDTGTAMRGRLTLVLVWLTLIAVAAGLRWREERRERGADRADFSAWCVRSWALTLGMFGGGAATGGRRRIHRAMVLSLSYFGLLASSMFGGTMLQNMMQEVQDAQIESMHELAALNWTVVSPIELYPEVYAEQTAGRLNETMEHMVKHTRWERMVNVQHELVEGKSYERLGVLMARSSMGLLRMRALRVGGKNGESVYHVARDVADYKPFGFLFMDWYITCTVEKVIVQSIESGILSYYRRFSEHVFSLQQRRSERDYQHQVLSNRTETEAKEIGALVYFWMVYAVFASLAFIVCVVENCWARWKLRGRGTLGMYLE